MSAVAFRLGIALSRAAPGRVRYGGARLFGAVGYLAGGRARRNALQNYAAILGLSPTDPRVRRVAREAMIGYAKLLADFLLLPSLSAAAVLEKVDVQGMEHIFRALEGGHGVIVVTPHFGNWDLAAAAAVAMGVPVTAITERFGSDALNQRVVASRERAGMEVVPLGNRSGKSALSALRRNRVVALVCDLPKDGRNLTVDLLGQNAPVPAGPAVLSLRTGAPIVPVTCRRLADNTYRLDIQPAVEFHPSGDDRDSERLAQTYIDRLAPVLRAHLEQWYLFSPMWSNVPGHGAHDTAPADPDLTEADRTAVNRTLAASRVLGFGAANFIFGNLPRGLSYAFMTALAWVVRTFKPGNLDGLHANLVQVFPEKREVEIRAIMRRNTRNYGRFWVDLFRIPKLAPPVRAGLVRVDGEEYLQQALTAGRGCLVVSIHMGGWEGCASYWGSRRDQFRTGLITEVLEPPALWRQILRLRQTTGLEIIPLGRSAPRDIIRRLRDNGVVAGAIDRDILGTAKLRSFFGAPAQIPIGMFEVAQRTGAPVLPVICLREPGDTYQVVGFEPITVGPGEEGVEKAVDHTLRLFERCIREHPDQWHVMAPIFPRPDATGARSQNSAGATAPARDAVTRGQRVDEPAAEEAIVG